MPVDGAQALNASDCPAHPAMGRNRLPRSVLLNNRISGLSSISRMAGMDPATDFRSMGALGLRVLVHFATRHTEKARYLVEHMDHTPSASPHSLSCAYPFAVGCINIASDLLKLLEGMSISVAPSSCHQMGVQRPRHWATPCLPMAELHPPSALRSSSRTSCWHSTYGTCSFCRTISSMVRDRDHFAHALTRVIRWHPRAGRDAVQRVPQGLL